MGSESCWERRFEFHAWGRWRVSDKQKIGSRGSSKVRNVVQEKEVCIISLVSRPKEGSWESGYRDLGNPGWIGGWIRGSSTLV